MRAEAAGFLKMRAYADRKLTALSKWRDWLIRLWW
jgi:hypothetical protein